MNYFFISSHRFCDAQNRKLGGLIACPLKPLLGGTALQDVERCSITLPQSNETDLLLSITTRLIRPRVVVSIPFYLRQADCSIGSNFVALRLERVRRYPIQAGETDDLETC